MFKHPDVAHEVLSQLPPDEDVKRIRGLLSKWVKYEEYLTVEINTETESIVVCEVE